MKKVEKQKLQRLIRQSLRNLCEAGIPDSTNINIEGLLGITVNSEYVVLVNIQEEIGEDEIDDMDPQYHIEERDEREVEGFRGGAMRNMRALKRHIIQRHRGHAMHPQVDSASAAVGSARMANTSMTSPRKQQFVKRTPPRDPKPMNSNVHFEQFDDREIRSSQIQPSFDPTHSTPNKNPPLAEQVVNFPFVNYNQSMFSNENPPNPSENQEQNSSNPTAPKKPMNEKPMTAEEVQASTICITPVVDSPKIDEIPQNNDTSAQEVPSQMSGISDFGRKIGTLMAVKQEGISRVKSKLMNKNVQNAQIEELSDSDSNTVREEIRTNLENQETSPSESQNAPSPVGDMNENQPVTPESENRNAEDACNPNISLNMDIEMLSHIDGDEQHQEFVLDHSFLQILPDVVAKHPDMIHDFIEIEGEEVKGEPRENNRNLNPDLNLSKEGDDEKESGEEKLLDQDESVQGIKAKESTNEANDDDLEVMDEGYKINIDEGGQLPEDLEEMDGFLPENMPFAHGHPPRHFFGRGFGHRGHFWGRRGGMCGRGGFFGRGGPMMGFGGHPFFHMGDRDKKLMRCKICGTCFLNKANYETHMLKHENKGQGSAGLDDSIGFSCPYCKKRFRYKSWLEQHITSHTKEKLYRCPYCSKAYTRRRNVHKHIEMFHPEIIGQHEPAIEETFPMGPS